MRRPNGTGSVYKLKGKRRKPFVVMVCVNEAGRKIKKKFIGSFESQKEALDCLAQYNRKPSDFLKEKPTFGEVFNMWKELNIERLSEKSRISMESAYRTHINKLEHEVLEEITPMLLQDFCNNLNLSVASKKAVFSWISQTYTYAEKMQIIDRNIVNLIDIRGYELEKETKIFTKEEVGILKNNLDIELVDSILIMIFTGMRVTEMLTLHVEHIHLEEGYIKHGIKTKAGKNRLIPILSEVKDLLKNRIEQASSLGYLFHLKNKEIPILYQTYLRKFGEILEKIGLEKHKTHDGRHTFITNAKRMKIDKTMLLQMVGHADEKTTDEVYTHFDINDLKSAMESFKIQ